MKDKLKALGIIASLVIVGIGIGILAGQRVMAKKDAEHAAFYNLGASVKGFVGEYGKAFEQAFISQTQEPIAAFYADRYPTMPRPDTLPLRRGDWTWKATRRSDGVTTLTLQSAEPWLTSKTAVVDAYRAYTQDITSIRNIRSKIDLIERIDDDRHVVVRVKFILDGTNDLRRTLSGSPFLSLAAPEAADA
ncbi:hypothetical protein C2W62_07275 [Candidatus Entotheonella serta]|nr:hypothetical protein C2W62_07275 [Candidatus Entotheonella serta]